jgi:hypothetical protein
MGARLNMGATNAGHLFLADRFFPLAFSSKIPHEQYVPMAGPFVWLVFIIFRPAMMTACTIPQSVAGFPMAAKAR